MSMRIVCVVAVAKNGVIGCAGRLPWRLPSDLKRFRALTLGKPVIMGRKTYQSIGRPLDARDNIVLTGGSDPYPRGVRVAARLEEALSVARTLALRRSVEEVAIIGGAEVFRAALPLAQRIYLTLVHAMPEGDRQLAPFPADTWRTLAREEMLRGINDEFPAEFIVLERLGATPTLWPQEGAHPI